MKVNMLMLNKKWLRPGLVFVVLSLLGGLVLPVVSPLVPHAYAATGEWIDAGHIKVGSKIYKDNELYDSMDYKVSGECEDVIKDFNGDYGEGGVNYGRARIITKVQDPRTGDCEDSVDESITLGSPEKALNVFAWVDAGALEYTSEGGGSGYQFKLLEGSSNEYLHDTPDECKSSVIVSSKGSGNTAGTGTLITRGGISGGCGEIGRRTVRIGSPANAVKAAGTGTGQYSSAEGSGPEGEDDSCESKGGLLGWIMCPLIFAIDGALNWVDSRIQELLTIDKGYYDNDGVKGAIVNIRNIAYVVLVPIMLVMIISTALGFEMISAYTVKKSLPRMVAAIIFITLAYPLCTFLIEFFNAIGNATLGIITAPFGDEVSGLTLSRLFGGSIFSSIGGAVLAAVGALVALWLFGSTLLLFAATAFLVLLLRQILIVAFLLLAPLAVLSWIFPGNDKLWKFWWGTFSKMLMMFPIIMGVIAIGRVFAFIIHESNPAGLDGAVLAPLMTLAAYMLPYAFIPFTFKLAGGAIATFSGMGENFTKSGAKRRAEKRSDKLGRAASRNLFKGGTESNLRGKFNTAAAGIMSAPRLGVNPARWRSRGSAALSDTSIQGREKMLNDDEYTWKGNDDLNKAAYESNNEADLRRILTNSGNYANNRQGRENMERDIAKVERMRRKYGNSAFRQAAWLQSAAGGTAHDTGPGSTNVWQGAASVAGNDDAILADLVAKGRGVLMNAGRVDEGGAGFMDTFRIARQFRNNPAYTADQGRADLARRVYDSQGGSILVHSSMKPGAVQNLAPEMVRTVDVAVQSGDTRAVSQSLASLAAVYDGLSASSPEKARIIADHVMNQDIDVSNLTPEMRTALDRAITTYGPAQEVQVRDPATGNMTVQRTPGQPISQRTNITVQQAIEALRGNQQFQEMRREYQSQVESIQNQPPPGPGGPQTGAPTGLPQGP